MPATEYRHIPTQRRESVCEFCDDTKFLARSDVTRVIDNVVTHPPVPCPHCLTLEERAERAGIDKRYVHARRELITPRDGNAELVELARTWDGVRSVVIASRRHEGDNAYGTGKTYAACALLISQLEAGQPAQFISAVDFLETIKRLFDGGGEQAQAYASRIARLPLLCIDDMGKEQATEWAMAQMFRLIDTRYRLLLPTIITTNVDYDGLVSRLGGALVDRLHDATWVAVGGTSLRGAA